MTLAAPGPVLRRAGAWPDPERISMTLFQTDPPLAEPLTLAVAKAHLRLDGNEEDDLLDALVRTAREHLERETGLCLLSQGWRLCLDRWPDDGVLKIARGPVRSIDAIRIYDADGVEAHADLSGHVLDGRSRPARLVLRNPPPPGQTINGIEIDFTAGMADSASEVPDTLRRAMLTHIAHMYAFRGVVEPEQQPAGVPAGYERLIAPFRLKGL